MTAIPKKILARQNEITAEYLIIVQNHMNDFLSGKVTELYEIRDFAAQMFIHPTHLMHSVLRFQEV